MHPERGGNRGTLHNQVKENTADTESNPIGLRAVSEKWWRSVGGELHTFVDTNIYAVCIVFDMIAKYSSFDEGR